MKDRVDKLNFYYFNCLNNNVLKKNQHNDALIVLL